MTSAGKGAAGALRAKRERGRTCRLGALTANGARRMPSWPGPGGRSHDKCLKKKQRALAMDLCRVAAALCAIDLHVFKFALARKLTQAHARAHPSPNRAISGANLRPQIVIPIDQIEYEKRAPSRDWTSPASRGQAPARVISRPPAETSSASFLLLLPLHPRPCSPHPQTLINTSCPPRKLSDILSCQ